MIPSFEMQAKGLLSLLFLSELFLNLTLSWMGVRERCVRGRCQPSVLLYERVTQVALFLLFSFRLFVNISHNLILRQCEYLLLRFSLWHLPLIPLLQLWMLLLPLLLLLPLRHLYRLPFKRKHLRRRLCLCLHPILQASLPPLLPIHLLPQLHPLLLTLQRPIPNRLPSLRLTLLLSQLRLQHPPLLRLLLKYHLKMLFLLLFLLLFLVLLLLLLQYLLMFTLLPLLPSLLSLLLISRRHL